MDLQYRIAIAGDHAGFPLKKQIIDYLEKAGYNVTDLGTYSEDSTDYPDYGHKVAEGIESNNFDIGITICKTGNGINMTANKHPNIRSALCWNVEIARLARAHNDANICALPGGFISFDEAKEIISTFLKTGFDGGRHWRRIKKIALSTK